VLAMMACLCCSVYVVALSIVALFNGGTATSLRPRVILSPSTHVQRHQRRMERRNIAIEARPSVRHCSRLWWEGYLCRRADCRWQVGIR
jgi:hypothetical protein